MDYELFNIIETINIVHWIRTIKILLKDLKV